MVCEYSVKYVISWALHEPLVDDQEREGGTPENTGTLKPRSSPSTQRRSSAFRFCVSLCSRAACEFEG